jgi:predicted transcriptional regulator
MNAMLERMPREKKPETESVRISKELAKKLRHLATHADVSMPEYLEQVLTPLVEAEFQKLIAELAKDKKK